MKVFQHTITKTMNYEKEYHTNSHNIITVITHAFCAKWNKINWI